MGVRKMTFEWLNYVRRYQNMVWDQIHAPSATTRTPETVLGVPSSEVGSKAVTPGSCDPRRESSHGSSTTAKKVNE